MFLIGGLGIFLYGLLNFSDYLKELAGVRLRSIIATISDSPLKGLLTGLIVTALWQSSSVTTVVAVALVNAGLLTFEASLGLIFGANIGTTITAQIVAFKITEWGFFIVPVGLVVYLLGKKKRTRYLGLSILSFGLLLSGLRLMELGLAPLKQSTAFKDWVLNFGREPWLGILVSAAFTGIIQSSSATTSMVVAMARQGLLTLAAAIPLILGANIGTTVTALLASIGARLNARRTAVAHFLFNTVGVLLIYPFVTTGLYEKWVLSVSSLTGDTSMPRLVANSHTLFNVIWSLFWVWQTQNFAKLVRWLVRGEEKVYAKPNYLDSRLLSTPTLALDALRSTLRYMAEVGRDMLEQVYEMILKERKLNAQEIWNMENLVDELHRDALHFASMLSEGHLTDEEAELLTALIQSLDDVERWGDHATNLLEFAEYINEHDVEFTPRGVESLRTGFGLVKSNVERAIAVVKDGFMESILELTVATEQQIDDFIRQIRQERTERVLQGKASVDGAIVYVDILTNIERVADHALNVIQNFSHTNRLRVP
ncbi:Na/Pi cotransporter family protein [Coprothermobacteraceae bacterium]|nr:Na/Pi cotransporter family protein [Coprothermobacteraceae bacterium]